jgi:hypothetical protein
MLAGRGKAGSRAAYVPIRQQSANSRHRSAHIARRLADARRLVYYADIRCLRVKGVRVGIPQRLLELVTGPREQMSQCRFPNVLASCLLIILETACAHTGHVQRILSVDDILRSGKTLDGQLVEVRGFVRYGDDSRNLWTSEKAYSKLAGHFVPPSDPDWNHCISLLDSGKWRKLLVQKNGSYIVISGVVRHDPRAEGDINFELCNELGLSIRSIQ